MSQDLERIAATLVADGKGILASDERVATLTRRFDLLGIKSTEQSRRAYREMLFTISGAAEFIRGVILYDETIRQMYQRQPSKAPLSPDESLNLGHKWSAIDRTLLRRSGRDLSPHTPARA